MKSVNTFNVVTVTHTFNVVTVTHTFNVVTVTHTFNVVTVTHTFNVVTVTHVQRCYGDTYALAHGYDEPTSLFSLIKHTKSKEL